MGRPRSKHPKSTRRPDWGGIDTRQKAPHGWTWETLCLEVLLAAYGAGDGGVLPEKIIGELETAHGVPVPAWRVWNIMRRLRTHGAVETHPAPRIGTGWGNRRLLWTVTAEGEKYIRIVLGRIAKLNQRAQERRSRIESREKEK